MAMISVFHTDDRGSIPRRGILLQFWIFGFGHVIGEKSFRKVQDIHLISLSFS